MALVTRLGRERLVNAQHCRFESYLASAKGANP
jgi:hypothetical protein